MLLYDDFIVLQHEKITNGYGFVEFVQIRIF